MVSYMMYLFELQYQVQKGIYFTNKITTDAYNIYYSKNTSEKYWNYAVLSDLCPIKSVLKNLENNFLSINRPVHIQVNISNRDNLDELQSSKFKVNMMDTWLRYDSGIKNTKLIAQKVSSDEDKINYLKIYNEYFSLPNPYIKKISSEILAGLEKAFDNENFVHFISYDGKKPAAIATVGFFNNYALLFNTAVAQNYKESEHPLAVLNACVAYCKKVGCISLNVNLLSNYKLEKWYMSNGFIRICGSCRMLL